MTDDDSTFICEKCGKTLPRYIDGEFQPSLGMNMGWGAMEWCRQCAPPGGNVEDIIRDFESFMIPPEE